MDEKQLNPFGSKVQAIIMAVATTVFMVIAYMMHENGDPKDPATAGGIGLMLFGAVFALVCMFFELKNLIHREQPQERNRA